MNQTCYIYFNNNSYCWSVVKNGEARGSGDKLLSYSFALGSSLWMERLANLSLSMQRVLYYYANSSRKVKMHVQNGPNEPICERLLFLLKINLMYEVACFISGLSNSQHGWLFFLCDIGKFHLFWLGADSEPIAYARGWRMQLVLGCFHVCT